MVGQNTGKSRIIHDKRGKKSQNKVYEEFLPIGKTVFFRLFLPFLPGFCLFEEAEAYAMHMHFREAAGALEMDYAWHMLQLSLRRRAEPPDEEAPKFVELPL